MTTESKPSTALPQAAVDLLWRGDMIGAIKLVRVERNIGLKDAKDLVDAYVRSQPPLREKMERAQAEALARLKRGLIIFLILAAAAAYFLFQSR